MKHTHRRTDPNPFHQKTFELLTFHTERVREREREKERERECVCERERERECVCERESERERE